MKLNFKKVFVAALFTICTSHSAFALTQEECQVKKDGLDNYKAIIEESIRHLFITKSRYRFATQKVLQKQVREAELRFSSECPNFVGN